MLGDIARMYNSRTGGGGTVIAAGQDGALHCCDVFLIAPSIPTLASDNGHYAPFQTPSAPTSSSVPPLESLEVNELVPRCLCSLHLAFFAHTPT